MGVIFSKSKKEESDYETILSELDGKIQQAEINLADIKIKQRRAGLFWILYGTLIWALYLLYCFIALRDPHQVQSSRFLTMTPAIVMPLFRKGLQWFYARKQTAEETSLKNLQAQQKLKLDELKKKTSYYTTQSLLERYDQSMAKKSKEPARPAPLGTSDSTLRQRKLGGQPPTAPLPSPPQFSTRPHTPYSPHRPDTPMQPLVPRQPQWYDRIMDVLIGVDGPESKYALICKQCLAHNGLALPDEIETLEYRCPRCGYFNPSRKASRLSNNPLIAALSTPPPPESTSSKDKQDSPSPSPEAHESDHDPIDENNSDKPVKAEDDTSE